MASILAVSKRTSSNKADVGVYLNHKSHSQLRALRSGPVSVWVKALDQKYRMTRFERKKKLKYGRAWSQKNGAEESKIFALTPGVLFTQRYCTLKFTGIKHSFES